MVHTTEENILRSGVIGFNKLFNLSYVMPDGSIANVFGNSQVAAITNGNIAGLIADVGALPVHETDKNFIRHEQVMIQKLSDLKVGPVAAPGVVTPADGGTNNAWTLLANTTYDYKFTAIDINGNESPASVEMSVTTANDASNHHKVTFPGLAAVVGAESYRAYRKLSTDTVYAGYLAASKSALEGATFADLGSTALTASGDAPTTGTAQVGCLTNAEVAAAKSTGTPAALLGKITADSADIANGLYLTSIDFGNQIYL